MRASSSSSTTARAWARSWSRLSGGTAAPPSSSPTFRATPTRSWISSIDAQLDLNRRAFRNARAAAAHLKNGGAYVTVQDTGGDFGLSGSARAWTAGLSALAKTAAQEWPKAAVRSIDLEVAGRGAERVAQALCVELLSGGFELEVGLSADGRRVTIVSEPIAIGASPSVLGASDVVLASGGARGVTATTLIALAAATHCKFVLLGRTALTEEPAVTRGLDGDASLKRALLLDAKRRGEAVTPAALGKEVDRILANREVLRTLSEIERVGGHARYLPIDVQDSAKLGAALAEVRTSWGPITALVHGAGVLADRFIGDKTDEQFERVFRTKVDGLRALLDATANDPLKAVVFFSSVAARCGNQGQCDYAMANEILNKVGVRLAKLRGLHVRSLGWGPWEGGMVTPALKARFAQLGVPMIALADGARMLVDELGQGSGSDVEIVLGGEPKAEALTAEPGHKVLERSFDVVIDEDTHPFVKSHVVKGVPVLPAVFVIELFARAARARSPELVVAAVRDVRVLRGVRLSNYGQGGDRFAITTKLVSNGSRATYELALTGEGGVKHYTARVEMEPRLATASAKKGTLGELAPWSDIVYGDVLFHGPMFHAIRDLAGKSERGIAGTLVGLRELGWSQNHAWETDPALLDGGLQLAVLWTKHALGGASLPTSIAAYVPHAPHAEGPFQAVAYGTAKNRDQAIFDVTIVDARGQAVATLEGVEVSVLPGSREELARSARADA
jgi:KR domain/Polyketide synthase dehydratase